jgi:hypothetical protein
VCGVVVLYDDDDDDICDDDDDVQNECLWTNDDVGDGLVMSCYVTCVQYVYIVDDDDDLCASNKLKLPKTI